MDTKAAGQGSDVPVSLFSVGIGLLIAGVILFFALVKAGFSLALPAAGVLLVGFTARLWIRLASARISFAMKPDRERLFPGETLDLELELANNKMLPVWVNLELPSPRYLTAPGGNNALETGIRLLSREKSRRIWRLVAERRGVSPLGPALVSAGDLLGLGTRTKSFASAREIVVFPRRLRMLPLSLPLEEYFGMHAAKGPVEDPVWYAGTRDYSGTRPAKNIHWKASARLGTLQEKLFEPTYHRKVLFVLDAGSYAFSAPAEEEDQAAISAFREELERDFERMLETLGTLAAALMETGAAFGLVSGVPGSPRAGAQDAAVIPAGRGPEQLGVFLETLARAEKPPDIVYESSTRPSAISTTPAAGFTATLAATFAAALAEASRSYTSLVYCGASPGKGAACTLREAGRRKRILFVFSRGAESFFEDRPACLAEELCR